MPSVVNEALDYARLGWHLLPGIPNQKRPYLKWAQASCDPDAVTKMFEEFVDAEILVLCGPSKLGVLDVDMYKAPLEVLVPKLDTWKFITPKGGLQFVFSDPESIVPTTAGRINDWTDTRGVGGLFVAPSSNSPKRKWVSRVSPVPPVWPSEAFPGLGRPKVHPEPHRDADGVLWVAVETQGERMPNEDCPGAYHLTTGRQPRLGVLLMPDGTYRTSCWSGCPDEEVHPLLVEQGRYTREELGLVGKITVAPSRFISRDELMAIEPPTWMVDPYLQENALVMLAAKFNTGKTFVAVNWALDLANQGKKVLYVALEGLTGLQSRVRAWEEHYERSSGDIRFSPRGYGLSLLNERAVMGFLGDVEAEGGFDLIVLDNLGEALPGDENDSSAVGTAMHALNLIRRAGGGAVLDLHNSGHGGTVRARGHSKMLDVHDTVIYLESIEGSINGLKVISGKERNAERFTSRRAQLVHSADSLVAVMGGRAVAEADPTYNAIKLGHDTIGKVAEYTNIPYSTAHRHVKELLEKGDIGESPLSGREKRYETLWDKPV